MIKHLTFIGLPCLGLDWLVLARLGFDEPCNLVVTSATSCNHSTPAFGGRGVLRTQLLLLMLLM